VATGSPGRVPAVSARLVVLASGNGSTAQAILDDPVLRRLVVAVGSERADAFALQRAAEAGVETFVVPFREYADRADWDRAFEQALADRAPDLVVLAGFMRLFDARNVERFRMVNTHPALLPAFPGAHAIRDALAAGATTTGVTVMWVDAGIDTGPVIAQVEVPVEPGDTEESLRERVQAAEKPLFVSTLRRLAAEVA